MNKLLVIAVILISLFISCDPYPQDEYEEYYVVEAYMMANNLLPEVRLSTTAPADDFYEFEDYAVGVASIEIHLLEAGPGSAVEESFNYSGSQPGIFLPNQNHLIKPRRTYELHITSLEFGGEIRAYTTIPDTFQIQPGSQDTVVYQSEEQLELTLTKSFYPGRQNIYVFNALAGDPIQENLTTLYADLFQDSDQPEEDLVLLSNNSSGIINEANFQENPDETISIRYPWLGIAFYGENKIVANTIDDNVYDFVRSREVQLGGSTLSPGEIQNVIYNIEGAVGVFGSLATDTVTTYIKRPSFSQPQN